MLLATAAKNTDSDDTLAQMLHAILTKHRLLGSGNVNLRSWVVTLRLMQKQDGIPEPLLRAALKWLDGHASEKYTPRIYSPATLRAKWPQLQEAIHRGSSQVVVGDVAVSVAAQLGLHWPARIKDDLKCIQLTLDNYTAYRDRLHAVAAVYRAKAPKNSTGWQAYRAAVYLTTCGHDSPVSHTILWVQELYGAVLVGRVRGKLHNHAWSETNSRWVAQAERLLGEYGGGVTWEDVRALWLK